MYYVGYLHYSENIQ